MTTTPTPAAVLAATIMRLSDEHTAQQAFHNTTDFMIVDDGKKRAALLAAIDRLREMAEGAHWEVAAWMDPAPDSQMMVSAPIKAEWIRLGGGCARLAASYTKPLYAAPVAAKQAEDAA